MRMKTVLLIVMALFVSAPIAAAQEAPGSYKGYPCTKDCSGHKAGYAWAEKKGVTSRDQCGGKSRSFVEGCYSWVDEQEKADAPSEGEKARGGDAESAAP